jgi:Sphingosine kinase and enzymes related to eukaryotic diacylglycerol kinase
MPTTVQAMIERYQIPAEMILTQRRGHATQLANDYAQQGFNHIVGVGGDGTFSEIIQALVHKPEVTFGAVSAGTGNDFIHILGFSDHFLTRTGKYFTQRRGLLFRLV